MEGIMIKEAAKMLDVESHVLRYWEEELGLNIKRNSMGHRFYDERDIKLFSDVKELKRRGLSLKEIRDCIERKKKMEKTINSVTEREKKDVSKKVSEPVETLSENTNVVDFKTAQMQTIMNKIIANALRENKDIITSSVKEEITSDVMRQFYAVMREKEEKEEARFKRLDEHLRQIQRANEEVAATKARGWFRRKR